MRRPATSPSLVPQHDVAVYLVLEDFGKLGRAWRETGEAEADEATIVDNLLTGQYDTPVRVIAFNTVEGWARDVSEDIARATLARARAEYRNLPVGTAAFVEKQIGETVESV